MVPVRRLGGLKLDQLGLVLLGSKLCVLLEFDQLVLRCVAQLDRLRQLIFQVGFRGCLLSKVGGQLGNGVLLLLQFL